MDARIRLRAARRYKVFFAQAGLVACCTALATACDGEIGGQPSGSDELGPGFPTNAVPQNPDGVPGDPSNPATGPEPGSTAVPPSGTDAPANPGDVPANPGEPNDNIDAPGSEPVDSDLPQYQAAPGMLRRLTRSQFRNAVRDVFAVDVEENELDADNWDADFATIGAASVVTSERGVEQYHAAIEGAVAAVFADPSRQTEFIGCTPSGAAADPCVRSFIETLGRRAWRRPLEASELDGLVAVAENATLELESAIEGARWATVALFTSPNFLYRAELGAPSANGSLRFTGYEMASRLAFLLWNSVPDDALLDEAASGALDTAEGVRTAATRLLDSPRGRTAVGAFAEELLRLDRIATQAKDTSLFPEYGTALQAAMIHDMRSVWEAVAYDDEASLFELFTTTKVVVNAELAEVYGLDATGLDSTTFQELELPEDSPQVGILSRAGFLSQFANQHEGSPTLRGKFIRQTLMCGTIPPPPGDVDIVLDEPPADMPMTKRERLELHRTDPGCAACHSLMDPLGLPFETFDAIGRYRTTELGLPIDSSGEFEGQPVADAREFGVAIGSSDLVAECVVRKYYSYALGHEVRDVDASVLDALGTSFETSGYRLRDLILDVVTHEAFSSVAPQL